MRIGKGRRELLVFTLSLQLGYLGLVGLDWIGLKIPVLRQVIGFVYLTFVPGFLIFKILRIDNENATETLLYSVGLSLSFLMFTGSIINFLYPLLGIPKPISDISIITTTNVIILFLCLIICHLHNRDFSAPFFIRTRQLYSPLALSLLILPFISIFGAHLLNYYNINTLLLALYFIISTIPVLVAFDKLRTKTLAIWSISISLLYSVALATKYLSYGDAPKEYSFGYFVLMEGIWNSSIPVEKNAMLPLVMLHPIYSLLLNMELQEVFRVVYPLLYSVTPVALYIAFKRQTNEKIAFFSTFFFMSFFPFYVILSRNTRSGIAELFLALLIFLLTDRNITGVKKSLLSVIFALSIIVSHYGISYVFMFALIASTLLLASIKKFTTLSEKERGILHPNFCAIYIAFAFAWYMYNAGGKTFNLPVSFIKNMLIQTSELLSPETSYTVYALQRDWVFSIEISLYLMLIFSIFIATGILSLIWSVVKREKVEFQEEFIIFSITFFGLLLITFLPTKSFNLARIYHTSLCFLSPFAIIGFITIFKVLGKIFVLIIRGKKIINNLEIHQIYFKIFSLFLIILLLFNSGFVSEVITKGKDYSPNIIISKPRALSIGDAQYIRSSSGEFRSEQEVLSVKWISEKRDDLAKIYLDLTWGFPYYLGSKAWYIYHDIFVFISDKTDIKDGYILLNTNNIARGVLLVNKHPPEVRNTYEVLPINSSNKIYTNGDSEVYYR